MNRPSPHDRRRLAVEATVHPRTVEAFFAGRTLQPMTRARIEAALVRLGFTPPNVVEASSELARSA